MTGCRKKYRCITKQLHHDPRDQCGTGKIAGRQRPPMPGRDQDGRRKLRLGDPGIREENVTAIYDE